MLLEHRSITDTLISDPTGQPAISRPLFDVLTGRSISALVASPGALAGGIVTGASSQFAGANAGFVANLAYSTDFTFDALFGFRYLDLEEKLDIVQTTQALSGGALVLAGMPVSALAIEDQFRTRNQFYGGQIGARGEYRFGPAFVRGIACVSFGPNHEVINIAGQTRELGGAGASVPSGLLAAGTVGDANAPTGNIGRQITNRFTVVPELTGQIGCALTPRIRSFVGYNFLYVSDVARPGTQIDLNVNPRLIPSSPSFGSLSGPAAPRPTLIRNDFVAHGVQFGLEFHF
jgi:hypothetical protein